MAIFPNPTNPVWTDVWGKPGLGLHWGHCGRRQELPYEICRRFPWRIRPERFGCFGPLRMGVLLLAVGAYSAGLSGPPPPFEIRPVGFCVHAILLPTGSRLHNDSRAKLGSSKNSGNVYSGSGLLKGGSGNSDFTTRGRPIRRKPRIRRSSRETSRQTKPGCWTKTARYVVCQCSILAPGAKVV